MRWAGTLCLGLVAVSCMACADALTPNNSQSITVAGLVSSGMSQPVPNADVTVAAFEPNSCGAGTLLQRVTGKTNTSGIYRIRLIAAPTGYSACIRASVGATSRDTTVVNQPAFSTVQVNITVP